MVPQVLAVLFVIASLLCPQLLTATGKIDVGATHVHVDLINNGSRVRSIAMQGVATNATVSIYKALVAKPSAILTEGEGNYFQTGSNIGLYIPVGECFSITPSAGGSYSWLRVHADIPLLSLYGLNQRFLTRAVNMAVDGSWQPNPRILLSASLQYAWARSHTTIPNIVSYKAESKGFNYILMFDYYLTECLTVNVTGAWQNSRDKERHGSQARGLRVGLGYFF